MSGIKKNARKLREEYNVSRKAVASRGSTRGRRAEMTGSVSCGEVFVGVQRD